MTIELSSLSHSACGCGSGRHLVSRSRAREIGAVNEGMMDGGREMAFGRKENSRELGEQIEAQHRNPTKSRDLNSPALL